MLRLSFPFRHNLLPRILVALVFYAFLIVLSFSQTVLQTLQQGGEFSQGYHNDLITLAFSSDITISFLPVVATIPLAAGYLDDVKNKFVSFLIIRGSYSSYLISQYFACWLCGGGVVLLGAMCTWGATVLIFSPLERVVRDALDLSSQILAQMTLLFLSGGLWAVTGMTLSTVMESKYIAYASPFITHYLLVILYERYFPGLYLLYPPNWLNPRIWPYGVGSAAFFLLEVTILEGVVFFIRGKRRLQKL